MRRFWLLCFLLFPAIGYAQTDAINGWCQVGNGQVKTSGLQSTNLFQSSYPKCQVTVYLTGTTTKATIYADNINTPLGNPFTAGANGQWLFYASSATGYDVVTSGGVAPNLFPAPVTYTDLKVGGGGGGGGSQTIVQANGISSSPISPVNFINSPTVTFSIAGNQISATSIATGLTLQHNGTPLTQQNLLNFNDTVPAAPTGFGDVVFQSDSAGRLSAYYNIETVQSGLTMQVVPPVTGQYVIIHPGTGVISADNPPVGTFSTANATSASLIYYCPNTLCVPGSTIATWSNFTYPSYVTPGNVTAIYAYSISSASAYNPSVTPPPSIACNGTAISNYSIAPGTFGWDVQQVTTNLSPLSPANLSSLTCAADLTGSLFGQKAITMNVSDIGLIVYYTGTAPPADNRVQVIPALQFNPAANTLSIDPLSLGFLGKRLIGGSISGSNVAQPTALPAASIASGRGYLISNGASASDCTTGGGTNFVLCVSNGSTWTSFGGGGGGGVTLQTNGTNNTSQTTLNFITSTTNSIGLTATPSNPATGNEKIEITGNLAIANLAQFGTATAGDVAISNGTAWTRLAGNTAGTLCLQENASGVASWGSCGTGSGVTIQTNGTPNTVQTTLNFITSTTNAAGLTITPSNPATGNEKMEITGSLAMANLAQFSSPTAGDIAVGNGSAWIKLAGNNSGTQCLTENSSGVASWGPCGSGFITGSGTTNTVPKFTGSTAVGPSSISDNGTIVSTTEPVNVGGSNSTITFTTVYTIGTLPSAATVGAGATALVSDATTFTVGTCTGGGSNYMIAVSNGSSWSCH